MPKATVNIKDTERHDLKSCPEGFVELRKLTFGEVLKRRQMATEISFRQQPGKSRKDTEAVVDMLTEAVALFDFKNCIVDHNLEDDQGIKLDFRSASSLAKLDPKIGEEINSLIDQANNFNPDESDGESGNSPAELKPV